MTETYQKIWMLQEIVKVHAKGEKKAIKRERERERERELLHPILLIL